MSTGRTHVVIMAGGIGSRFWPVSTPDCPKQFIDILGCGKTLIQLTAARFEGICPEENMWVVTNERYIGMVKEQLPGMPESHILAEPAARNTAPCIAWACWHISRMDPDANIVVTPSDAYIDDPAEFRRVISSTLEFASGKDAIVTIGIKPSRPETGYGYIQKGKEMEGEIHAVDAFKEKPCLDTAKEYLADGRYLWNAGIFVWNARTISSSIRTYKPGIADDMDRIMKSGDVQGIFPLCEKISIDFAVMEPAAAEGKVYTHPADFGWSDLGNWQSLYERLPHDPNGNAVVGNVKLVDCFNCIVHAHESESILLQGLENRIVSLRHGKLLVCERSEEQRIKDWNN